MVSVRWLLAVTPLALHAQQPLAGVSAPRAAAQRALEAAAIAIPHADTARRISRALAAEPHIAGTAAQERTRDFVNEELRRLGLRVENKSYRVYLPHAVSVSVEAHPARGASVMLPLDEPPIPGAPQTAMPQYPTVNGYSGEGTATGEVVYVNYGLVEDYAQLDAMGVSVRGKVVVARYGRSFRGIKAREAEKHGAVALLIYSDPIDDGFVRGDVYPVGPMRPPRGVQRGSVYNGQGDPSTPGYPSLPNAPRLTRDQMAVPKIPVVPIGYGTATQLLTAVQGGPAIPQAWQGGLPFRYHIGPGPMRATVRVQMDTMPYKTIHNTLATLRGAVHPDEVVVIGGHRDAWNAGSGDNVSGVTSILESARAVVRALGGAAPARTLVFATWDAEEWGLVGSSEYVEDDSLRLSRNGVAYINLDVSAQGMDFGAGGSPSLRGLTRELTQQVPDPTGTGMVADRWRARARASGSDWPAMGDPGGGSDFAGFYNHLGIPHADWGFGGPSGIYHSAYDSPHWMEHFGDSTYVAHAAAGRLAAAMLLRLANAEVVPFDYGEFGRTMQKHTSELALTEEARAPLHRAWESFAAAGDRFRQHRDAVLARGTPSVAVQRAVNASLRQVERRLTRPEGLRSRPWVRGLIYAADIDNGYSTMVFPSIGEALRAKDLALALRERDDLITRIGAAAAALTEATAALR